MDPMLLQHTADGILTGAIIALGAIGVTLSMTILRFANFGHSELVTFGAYVALIFLAFTGMGRGVPIDPFSIGWGFFVAIAVAGVGTALLALATDWLIFRRLRNQNAARLTFIFASFGAALVLRNLIMLGFGASPEYYSRELTIAILVPPGIRVMPDQVLVLLLTGLLVLGMWLFLTFTRAGLAMRAVAESPTLSEVSGIDVRSVTRWTWVLSGALAAMAGVFFGLTVQLRPEMGFNLLLPLFAAAILGGAGSVFGAVVGGLIVGLAENLSVIWISPGYKMAVPFILMLLLLYIRPHGLFGKAS